MNEKSRVREHKAFRREMLGKWIYADNDEEINLNNTRSCMKCKRYPTTQGYDACLGALGKVTNACCGHGIEEGYIQFDNGVTIRGYFDVERNINHNKLYEETLEEYIQKQINKHFGLLKKQNKKLDEKILSELISYYIFDYKIHELEKRIPIMLK